MPDEKKRPSWRDFGFGTVDGFSVDERHKKFQHACRRLGTTPEASVIKGYLDDLIKAEIDPNAPDGALRQHLAERKVAQTLALLFAGENDPRDRDDLE